MEYKEKLRLAKEALDSGSYDKETVEYIFPELAESEGERIRKVLIDYVNRYKEQEECGVKTFYGIPTDDILAWLEKQGEHKPTAEEVLIKAGLKPYKDGNQWCVLLGDNIQEGICGFGNTIEDALYAFLKDLIASQGEQKQLKDYSTLEITDVVRQALQECKSFRNIRTDVYAARVGATVEKLIKKQGEQKPADTNNKFIRMRENKPKDISEFLDRLTTVEQEFLWEHIAKIRELDKEEQKPNPYSGTSFEYNGHTYGMCARDNGVDILIDSKLKTHVSLDTNQNPAWSEVIYDDRKDWTEEEWQKYYEFLAEQEESINELKGNG